MIASESREGSSVSRAIQFGRCVAVAGSGSRLPLVVVTLVLVGTFFGGVVLEVRLCFPRL